MSSSRRAECVSFNGKGRKQRWTAISEVALAALRTYLEDFRGWSEGQLFQTFDGRAASQSPHERHVHPTRGEGWGEPGQPPPLPSHVCYLGDSGQCPRARCPVLAWSFEPDDGPSLLCDLRLRAGGKGARCLQSGDAAVGEVRRGGRRAASRKADQDIPSRGPVFATQEMCPSNQGLAVSLSSTR